MEVQGYCEYYNPYDSDSKYIIRMYHGDGSEESVGCLSAEETIPPVFYDYSDVCDPAYSVYYDSGIYDIVNMKLESVFAIHSNQDETCRKYSLTIDDECDWLTDLGQFSTHIYSSTWKMNFVRIEDNETGQDRETTVAVNINTTLDGDCEPINVKILQRSKVTTCEEVTYAIGDYYENNFISPLWIHSSYTNKILSDINVPLFVPYGRVEYEIGEVDGTGEDGNDYIEIPAIWSCQRYYNSNFIDVLFHVKGDRDVERFVNVTFKTILENGVVCELLRTKVQLGASTPPPQPVECSCSSIRLSYYGGIYIPSNLAANCSITEIFGYNGADSSCGTITGETCDENGNPTTYDWIEITDYTEGRCGGSTYNDKYCLTYTMLRVPDEEEVAYYHPYLINDQGERIWEECGDVINYIVYDPNCSNCNCDVYRVDSSSNINRHVNLTPSDLGTTIDLGYFEIGLRQTCYTLKPYACCLRGEYNSTNFVGQGNVDTFFDNPVISADPDPNNHRIHCKFDFVNLPDTAITVHIGITIKSGSNVLVNGSTFTVEVAYTP